jgi:hypothetical protein
VAHHLQVVWLVAMELQCLLVLQIASLDQAVPEVLQDLEAMAVP